jgi:peptidoglycan L-alanyl-D-glutamate endopeptidase CwlK
MPSFGKVSMDRLNTCHPKLIELFQEVVKHYDCIILCGNRSKDEQDEAYRTGKSKLAFPKSKHNSLPSMAVDVAPYFAAAPNVRWNDKESFYHFSGFVFGIAAAKGIKLRWGGDWDSDKDLKDQNFFDLPHFELDE